MGAELCYQGTTLEAAEQVVTWQGQAGANARCGEVAQHLFSRLWPD